MKYSLVVIWMISNLPYAAFSQCNPHPLFSMLPQHSVSRCEEKEYEVLKLAYYDKTDKWVEQEKAGYQLKTVYSFDGEWEKRPSNAMIFQNYAQAALAKGGTLVSQSNSMLILQLKQGTDSWWVKVESDQSGSYTLNCLKEQAMNQYIVLSAEDISRQIASEGKAAFYGIYFDTDKADIKPESTETLDQMAKYLSANPKVEVYIVGHTDNTGAFDHNQRLSLIRAEAVLSELVKKYQIPASRLKAFGVGSLSPVANNATEEGKSKNRRVEMVLK